MRRVVYTKARSIDHEPLQIVTVYPDGTKKEEVKRENKLTKQHSVLVWTGQTYEFKA